VVAVDAAIVGALCRPTVASRVTDASTSDVDAPESADATDATDAPDASGGTGSVDDRPERPPVARLVDALGFVDHAKRGFVAGMALALGVFGFFVVLPAVDPGTPARTESVVLYVALAFVVATSGTLLVASALAVRAVAGRVMDYGKWVRRGGVVAAAGGAWWAFTGVLALAVGSGSAPAGVEALVLSMLPLPVLVLAVGAWAVLARTGALTTDSGDAPDSTDPADGTGGDAFDHVLSRSRLANASGVLVLVGVAVVHVATFLQTDAFLGTTPTSAIGATVVVLGGLALATGTATLAEFVRRTTTATPLPAIASALAGAAIALTALAPTTPLLTPLAILVLPGLAWTALGVAVARDAGTYPERPV